MLKVETRLSEQTIKKIEATGKTVYTFSQEAIREKLERDTGKKQEQNVEEIMQKLLIDLARHFNNKLAQLSETIKNDMKIELEKESKVIFEKHEVWFKHLKNDVIIPLINEVKSNG